MARPRETTLEDVSGTRDIYQVHSHVGRGVPVPGIQGEITTGEYCFVILFFIKDYTFQETASIVQGTSTPHHEIELLFVIFLWKAMH